MKRLLYVLAIFAIIFQSCQKKEEKTASGLLRSNFQTVVNGDSTNLYVLKNASGMEVCITNFGGRIVSIMAPDKNGKLKDVVLGFDNVKDYINIPSDFGASIGRYANRIYHGQLIINGDTIHLPTNNFGHTLHGGPKGWQYQIYKDVKQYGDSVLQMTRFSPDGDMGFPGDVKATVTFKLRKDNAIDIHFRATTDKKTVINMCNHSYFNLNGDPTQNVLNDTLYINANSYTPIDSSFMTTGAIDPVANTPLDFRTPKTIGKDINDDNIQMKNARGYDFNFVLNTHGDDSIPAARLVSPVTGITLTVYTTEPGLQMYTGNFLDGTVKGKHGIVYNKHAAVCMESQHYPDSPNKPQWPSTFLSPGQVYHSHVIYKFGVEK